MSSQSRRPPTRCMSPNINMLCVYKYIYIYRHRNVCGLYNIYIYTFIQAYHTHINQAPNVHANVPAGVLAFGTAENVKNPKCCSSLLPITLRLAGPSLPAQVASATGAGPTTRSPGAPGPARAACHKSCGGICRYGILRFRSG